MRSFAALAIAATLGFSTLSATAMPVDPNPDQGAGLVTQVRDGCGPGRYRGPYGRCHPLPGVGYRMSGGCGPGWHRNRWGHCRRNW